MMASKRSKAVSLHSDYTALLLIDLITDFEFDDGDKLLKAALPAAKSISGLKRIEFGRSHESILGETAGGVVSDWGRSAMNCSGENTADKRREFEP